MDEGKPVNIITTFLLFILIIGLGFGGYFVGKVIDESANKKAIAENQDRISKLYARYTNNDFKIDFIYPKDWKVETVTKPENVSENIIEGVTVTAPTGSRFVFQKITNNKELENDVYSCDKTDPNGTKDNNEKCTFLDAKFARFPSNTKDQTGGERWSVAEQVDSYNPDIFVNNPNNDFGYFVVNSSDLDKLDAISKSIKRL